MPRSNPPNGAPAVASRDQLAAEVKELGEKLKSEDRRLRLMQRQFAALPHAHKRAALFREQEALGEVTLLPADAAQRREEAEKEQRRLMPLKEEAEKHIAQLANTTPARSMPRPGS